MKLGAVTTKIGSGATPRGGAKVYRNSGVALIRSQNVRNEGFLREGLAHISPEAASRLDGVTVALDDVLLNITGDSVARACAVPADVLPARVNQHVAIVRANPEQLSPSFLLYFLVAPTTQTLLLSLAGSGATRNALTKVMIERLDVPEIDVTLQRGIGAALKTLDDKIDINRRISETLEATARALFKSWFVDFDPMRGTATVSEDVRRFFPDRLVDSRVGPMPEGWEVGPLGSIVDLSRELLDPRQRPTETFNHFSIPAFDRGHMPEGELGESIKSTKLMITDECLLVSKLNPRISRVWWPVLRVGVLSICSTEFLVTLPHPPITREFLYCQFVQESFRLTLGGLVRGTSGSHQRVSPRDFQQVKVIVPPGPVVAAFTAVVAPMFQMIGANLRENETLANVRDTLLPRLISGEVRLKDVS